MRERIVKKLCTSILFIAVLCLNSYAGQVQRFAELGDFRLDSGEVIRDCKVGYRTFGHLNANRSNAIIYPSWFGGTSEHLGKLIGGPEKLVDSTGFFIIAFDAFGNGISSSPSNSIRQPGDKFPVFTIHDMVRAQYEILTQKMNIDHLHAAIGGSMGSFQVFEWLVSYPQFIDKAIPYVCSPRMTSYERLILNFQMDLIEAGTAAEMPQDTLIKLLEMFTAITGRTPEYLVKEISREEFPGYISRFDKVAPTIFTPANKASQIRAMLTHDISRNFKGSLEKAGESICAEVAIIVSASDHIVRPEPALELAKYMNWRITILDNNCGHLAIGCEMDRCVKIVNEFLRE